MMRAFIVRSDIIKVFRKDLLEITTYQVKCEWEGKLKSDNPDVLHGTCIWFFENGQKSKECLFNNGQQVGEAKEWDENGQPIEYIRTYKVVNVLTPQKYYINNPLRFGGKHKIILPITLPENTVSWYYTFAASREQADIQQTQESLSLLSDLTKLVDQSKMSSVAMNMLITPTGANVCDVYVLDYENQSKFMSDEAFSYKLSGSRLNYASGTVNVDRFHGNQHYIGVENPTTMYGIHFTIEVVAVTVDIRRK